jgi:hypothetical protein
MPATKAPLSPTPACWRIFHLLPHRDIMLEPVFRGIPPREKWILGGSYPVQSALLSLLLRLSAARAQDALTISG